MMNNIIFEMTVIRLVYFVPKVRKTHKTQLPPYKSYIRQKCRIERLLTYISIYIEITNVDYIGTKWIYNI